MIDILIDTNILIYLAQRKERYLRFFEEEYADKAYAASAISLMEVFMGIHGEREQQILEEQMEQIVTIPLTEEIVMPVAKSLCERDAKNLRSPLFPDTIIAHTALTLGVPLVTNNPKNFAVFRGLELIVP